MKVSEKVILGRILESLNERQRQAVTSSYKGRLQIIAGPGTGKTKLLVSRVAHLLIVDKIKPDNLIVTTFTKKAANEMTDRLHKLLAGSDISIDKLIIGTFHSICYRIIKRYGTVMGLEKYTIADERDKLQLMKQMIEGLKPEELKALDKLSPESLKKNQADTKNHGYDVSNIVKQISSLKSKAIFPDHYMADRTHNKALAFFYLKYQEVLADNQKLDFDDCLIKCYILIRKYPVLNYIKHVLVDEFQDTNEIQLQLVYHFAQGHMSNPEFQHNVTIVGDPDQSIYGFRDAQAVNFKKMVDHYEKLNLPVAKITLDENYRSTSDILKFSELVMRQQQGRHLKDLKSQSENSIRPVYGSLGSAEEEAKWIMYQIEHLLALPGSAIKFKDIAVLVRAGFQTRALETELVSKKIPYRMIRGKAFWDRKEVLAIMDYLRVCGDENDHLSVARTLNYPKRGLGPKTLDKITECIAKRRKEGKTVHEVLRSLAANHESDVKLSAKNIENIQQYVKMIDNAQEKLKRLDAYTGDTLLKEVQYLFEGIYQDSSLRKELQEDSDKRLNVEEVGSQLCKFVPTDETLPDYIGAPEDDIVQDERNFITRFIESIGLYDSDDTVEKNKDSNDDDENSTTGDSQGISLSTIHGSKGLEWPVVFVPGLSEGLLPSRMALAIIGNGPEAEEPIHEERRCFYVATTRAKTLLYISSYTNYSGGSWNNVVAESRFVSKLKNGMTSYQSAFRSVSELEVLYKLLEKELIITTAELDQFYHNYKKEFEAYSRGAPMKISMKPTKRNNFIQNEVNSFGGFRTAQTFANQATSERKYTGAKSLNKAPPYIPVRPLKKSRKGTLNYRKPPFDKD